MPGTKEGGRKAAAKNLANDPNFYKKIGKLSYPSWVRGGKKPKGFSAVPGLAQRAGSIGGKKSKRTKNV